MSGNVPATPDDAFRQIRASMKILALMEVQGNLDRQAIADADADVEAALAVLERRILRHETAAAIALPIMTLRDVVAESRRKPAPGLQLIVGGQP